MKRAFFTVVLSGLLVGVSRLAGAGATAPVSPIEIISQSCSDQTIEEFQTLTLSVAVTGTDPVFRWFLNGAPIPGATIATHMRTASLAASGDYWVVITNILGAVTGCVVKVTVTPDIHPPGLDLAVAQETTNGPCHILIQFNERILPASGTNPANYSIRAIGSANQSLAVSNAQVSANVVRLTVPPLAVGSDYVLTVRNVADLKTNAISPLSNRVVIVRPPGRVVFPFSGVSRVWNAAEARARGVAIPQNWREPDFDDSDPALWVPGRGILHCNLIIGGTGGELGDEMCAVFSNPTTVSNRSVFYIRSHFTTDTNIAPKCLQLQYSFGNPAWFGADFHLNGRAIHHQDPYVNDSATNGASATDGLLPVEPAYEWSQWIPARNLRHGDNVVATEVSGQYFNLEVYALQVTEGPQTALPPLPRLCITAGACPASAHLGNSCAATVTWPSADFPGWILQSATNLDQGPWTNVATNSPYAVEMVPSISKFFRLQDGGFN